MIRLALLILALLGIAMAYWFYLIDPSVPAQLAKGFPGVLASSCSTNGISTSCMTACSCSPRSGWRTGCGRWAIAK